MTDLLSRATAVLLIAFPAAASGQQTGDAGWIELFNGRDLAGWTPKIAGHEVGVNHANTFRVENGVLKVGYDGYNGRFANQFGHLFYNQPFSHYHLVIEYRFTGEWLPDTPSWAFRNSGAMLHSQDPKTMPSAQDFPISVEFQFLGGLSNGRSRSTGNMCSPGTEVTIGGTQARGHCVNSSSPTFDGDQWVRAEAIVRGDSAMTFVVNGDTVLRLTNPRVGGGNVAGFDPAAKRDSTVLGAGYIALQSEGHPIEFRVVRLQRLGAGGTP